VCFHNQKHTFGFEFHSRQFSVSLGVIFHPLLLEHELPIESNTIYSTVHTFLPFFVSSVYFISYLGDVSWVCDSASPYMTSLYQPKDQHI